MTATGEPESASIGCVIVAACSLQVRRRAVVVEQRLDRPQLRLGRLLFAVVSKRLCMKG